MLAYFAATILLGAVTAPFLFWAGQALASHGIFPALAKFDFESFFHRALMLGALVLFWPFLRWLQIRNASDLGLTRNRYWLRELGIGFLISTLPVICCEIVLVRRGIYSMRDTINWSALGQIWLTTLIVPLIEEALFRGLFLGILLRGLRGKIAVALSAAIFSIVHFLKAPEQTTTTVQWNSGLVSLAHSFDQFGDPMLVLAGFMTLFVIGLILAHARLRTASLWLPIGLHAGWILASGAFGKIARREIDALPWIGKNLLVGLVPLAICLLTWALLTMWLRYAGARDT